MNTETLPKKISLKAEYSRKYPDPLNQRVDEDTAFNIEHHIILCKAKDIPQGISKEPNPREQRIDYGIYKDIQESLEDSEDLTFHLKNKGITILANKVDYSSDKKNIGIHLGEKGGIADGAHTYEIVLNAQRKQSCPEDQYVKFEIITGVPSEMIVDITGGLNTAVQVQQASLANLEGAFEWVKEEIKNMSYAEQVSYKQNEKKAVDIREILSFLTLFNVKHFNGTSHPKIAYTSKASCLDLYEKDPESFKMLRPLLKDILTLHDYIHIESRKRYNQERKGAAGKMKGVYDHRTRGKYKFVFTDQDAQDKLHAGTLYPIFGALRFLIKISDDGSSYSWKVSNFREVLHFFDSVAANLVETTYKTSLTYGRKPNAVGKDDNHWDNLYKTVALHYLTTVTN
ncbi:MAG: AIPR family protein [Candidatus Omnitrophica bacterium]|nr:AIPR family protein [Candidatus Omnitrophota bacterium]